MSSFEALSWGSSKKLSPLAKGKDSFDFKFFSCNVYSTRKTFKIPDKVFLKFPKTCYIQVQFTIIKIFLRVNCTMTE